MTSMQLTALEYVKNTNGGATKDHFIEDHEPIGTMLWDDLWKANAVITDANDRIQLTSEGERLLKEVV